MKHIKTSLAKTAVAAVAVGAVIAALGSAPAFAQGAIYVQCNTNSLETAVSTAPSGSTLVLPVLCTFYLTSGLTVDNTLTFKGQPSTITRASGYSGFSLLTVGNEGDVVTTNVNFTNGDANSDATDGGAIYNDGYLTIERGNFSDNFASESGGAIYNDGLMWVHNANFVGNQADESGGAIYNEDEATMSFNTLSDNGADHGGALYNEDSASSNTDTYENNQAEEGGAVFNDYHTEIYTGTFRGNQAEDGGAIYNEDEESLSVVGSKLNDNFAASDGGGIWNEGTETIAHSTITENLALDSGGGIFEDGTTTLFFTSVVLNFPDNCEPIGSVSGCFG